MSFEKMLLNPAKYFDHPEDIGTASGLSVTQKLELLERWETDARMLQAAAHEGMDGGEEHSLHAVHKAVNRLQAATH